MTSHPAAVRLGVVAAALLVIGGCGLRGTPVAPETRLPAAASALAGSVENDGIQVSWSNPTRRVDGSRLRDLVTARVYRLEDPGEGAVKPALLARGRIAGYGELVTLRLAPPTPVSQSGVTASVQGERAFLSDRRGLTLGRRYTYVVVTEDTRGRVSPPSGRLSILYIAAPEPPRDLVAEASEGEVRLRWQPPARLIDGSAVTGPIGYEVLRAVTPDGPLVALTPPILGTSYLDRAVENDHTYAYAVRAGRIERGTTARGTASAPVTARPVKVTPPSAPSDLVAIPSEDAVRLSWKPTPEPDIARYVVYRATATGDFARVGSAEPPATTFVDRDVPAGTYRYAVTAEDTSSRANESPRSNEVTATVP